MVIKLAMMLILLIITERTTEKLHELGSGKTKTDRLTCPFCETRAKL